MCGVARETTHTHVVTQTQSIFVECVTLLLWCSSLICSHLPRTDIKRPDRLDQLSFHKKNKKTLVHTEVCAVNKWRPAEGTVYDTESYLVGSEVTVLVSHTTVHSTLFTGPFSLTFTEVPEQHSAALHSHWHFAQGSFSYSCASTPRLRTLAFLRSPPPSRTPPSRRRAASSLAYTPRSCVYRPYICVFRERGEKTQRKGRLLYRWCKKTHKKKWKADTWTW